MLCPECNKREASIHLTQIVNNQKITVSMCKECADKFGFHSPLDNVPFPLAEILSGMTKDMPAPPTKSGAPDSLVCDKCKLSFEDFARQGRFGCGGCYAAFRPRLEMIMRKIHGASLHRGRRPGMITPDTADVIEIKEEERLAAELKKAIVDEDFERAAELRDKLKATRIAASVETDREAVKANDDV